MSAEPGRAFVTGATGFVGTHLTERLVAAGWDVTALTRTGSDVGLLDRLGVRRVTGDLSDEETLRRAAEDCRVVYHLAAATAARDPEVYHRVNVAGSRRVAEAARCSKTVERLVYLSSYAAGGPATAERPRRADDAPAPLTEYGRTKLAGEEAVRRVAGDGTRILVIRAPVVYGPRDRDLLSYFRLVRRGFAPMPGDGSQALHLIFAPDLARALEAGAGGPGGTCAVAEPRIHRWAEVVDAMAAAVGSKPVRVRLPATLVRGAARITEIVTGWTGAAAAFNREKAEEMLADGWVYDLEGANALLSPEEVTPLREGMRRTVQWYETRGWL